MSQEELAHQADMHPTAISFYERGLRQPTLHTVFILAQVLGMAPSAFVLEVEKLRPNLDGR